MAYRGAAYNVAPSCSWRGCGVSYFVNYVDRQEYTEIGFYEGKLYFRHNTFLKPWGGTTME